jgi:hypothetical protein
MWMCLRGRIHGYPHPWIDPWISTWIFLFRISACPIRLIPATSAAPTYFKSIVAGDVELVDGGLGTNNPLGW